MRKFRAIVAFFMVILIQITPWPLGLRPAHAVLPVALPVLVPVAVGALVLAAGAAGSGTPAIYSQAVYDASKTVVDSVTGDIKRTLIAATALGVAGNQTFYGASQQVLLAFDTVVDWVKSHLSDFPLLSVPVSAASTIENAIDDTDVPPIGTVLHAPGYGNYKITGYTTSLGFAANSYHPQGLGYYLRYSRFDGVELTEDPKPESWQAKPDGVGHKMLASAPR